MTEVKALALEFYYINVTDSNFKEGILYTVTVRTMAKMENGVTVLSSVVDDTRGSGQKKMMRTRPPPINSILIGKTEQLAKSIDVTVISPPTMQIGPIYQFIVVEVWEIAGSDGRILAKTPVMIEHTTGTSLINFKPIPAEYPLTISNLTTGTQYEIEIRTIASGTSDLANSIDRTESVKVSEFYTVSFDGPQNITKVDFDSNSITLEWIAIEMEGISHYEVKLTQ